MTRVSRLLRRRGGRLALGWKWVLVMGLALEASSDWGAIRAATKTFRGTLDNGSFSRGANWVPNGVPQDGDDVVIDPVTLNDGPLLMGAVATNDLPNTLRVGNLTLAGSRLFGRPLIVTGKIEGYLNVPEIHVDLTLTGDREVRADAGRLELSGAVTTTGDLRLVVGGPRTHVSGQTIDGTLEIRGPIRGTGNVYCVQDTGPAEGILITGTQANSYAGTLVIDGPPVIVTRTGGRVFTGMVEVRRGRLGIGSDDAALAGAAVKALAGTDVMVTNGLLPALHLVNSSSYVRSGIGDLTMEGSDLWLVGGVGDIWLPADGGLSVITGQSVGSGQPKTVRVESGSALTVRANLRLTNGSPSMVKAGGGLLELTGTNWLGAVEIQSGRLRVAASANLNAIPAPIAVRSSGVLQVQAPDSDPSPVTMNNVGLTLYDGARLECGNVVWDGNVQTYGMPVIGSTRTLELRKAVHGPGGLAIENGVSGAVRVSGTGTNALSGLVHLRSGGMELQRSNAWGNARWVLESNAWARLDSAAQTVPAVLLRGGQVYSPSAVLTLLGPLMAEGASEDSQVDCSIRFDAGGGVISNSAPLRVRGSIASSTVIRKVGLGDLTLVSGASRTEAPGWRLEEGRLIAEESECFGAGVPVSVLGGAILRCVSPEGGALVFMENALQLEEGAIWEGGNCIWRGVVELVGMARVRPESSLSLLGSIMGPGGMTVEGGPGGELDLRSLSTYAGVTRVLTGTLRMGRAGVVPGRLIVGQISGPLAVARWAADDAIQPSGEMSVLPTGLADLNGYGQTVSELLVQGGEIRTGLGELTLRGDLVAPPSLTAGPGLVRGRLGLPSGQHLVEVSGTPQNGLVLAAVLTGAGGLTKAGPGWLQLTGPAPNEHQGSTWVRSGLLTLSKSNFVDALAGASLVVESNATVRWEANGQLAPETSVTGAMGARFDLGTVLLVKPEGIGSLAGDGLLQVGSNIVQVGGNNASTTFGGIFEGRGAVVKMGTGTWTLTSRNPYAGAVRSAGGRVRVDGALLAANVLVTNSSGLAGTGFVQSVTVASNAVLAPGASPGILTAGDLTLRPGARLVMELDGNGPGTGFDQVEVAGTATIAGAVAELHLGFVPVLGKTFRLINVTSPSALNGTFRGWAQSGTNGFDGLTLRADYQGGTGNDFVAEVVSLGTLAPNQPPAFAAPAAATVAEGDELARVFAAPAPEPNQTVTFFLAGSTPAGADLDPATGAFAWTPREGQGPSTNLLTIVALDNGQPALSVTQVWTVVVTEVNTAPVSAAIPAVTLAEGETLDLQVEATDSDRPPQRLEYALLDAVPNGLTLDPAAGRLRWTPGENQGSSTTVVRVKVSDSGSPRLSVTNAVQIVVTERNEPPVLEPLLDRRVEAGQWVEFDVRATDPDRPANALIYSLGAAAPARATVDAQTGLFRWLPTGDDIGTHVFRVEVSDQGVPPKNDRQQLRIEIVPATPAIVDAELLASGLVELSWSTNLISYELVRSGQLVSSNWVVVPEISTVRGGRYRVEVTPGGAQRYFRLRSVR